MMTRDDVRLEWLAEEVSKTLDAAGVKVPDNEAAPLPLPENRAQPQDGEDGKPPLYIVGVGDKLARHDDPARALNRVPKETPRLALMHNPDSFAKFLTGTAPLALAGHTHGGQIRLPFMPEWSWMSLVSADEVHADGWIDGYGQSGNRLYVNRRIDFSLVPIHISCQPEVTLFTLRRAK